MTLILRHETASDIDAITHLTIAAFKTAPHTSHTEQHIVNALRHSGQLTLSLVAEAHGTLLGHLALSPVELSSGAPGWFGLGPVSVDPKHQNQGIGSALIQAALAELRAMGGQGCVVLGEPHYYARFGFRSHAGLTLPGVPPAYFQALPFGPEVPSGNVRYSPAFEVSAPSND